MSLPSSASLFNHVHALSGKKDWSDFGGNLNGLGNYCCVRLSYALIKCGHPIQRTSDYKDKNGTKYIIRTLTMEEYLNQYYKKGISIQSIKNKSGIIFFKDCGFGDANGHFDVVVNGQCADKSF